MIASIRFIPNIDAEKCHAPKVHSSDLASSSGDKVAPGGTDSWQQRTLTAEQKAERTHEAICTAFFAQLKQKLLGSVVSQRDDMLDSQRSAAEMERALVVKGEENRELIRARIEMMRKQLEADRPRNHLEFN